MNLEEINRTVTFYKDDKRVEIDINPEEFQIRLDMLDGELCSIPKLMLSYGLIEAQIKAEVGHREANLEQGYSALDANIRAVPDPNVKLTETKIKNSIINDPIYQGLAKSLAQSRANYSIMRWVMVALQQKSEALRALAYRENALIKADARIN